jgi:hypothetical protein
MASTIPRAYRKEITDAIDAEVIYVALFTNSLSAWTGLNDAEKTYTQIAAIYTEATGTGYTAGGKVQAVTSSVGVGNSTILTADLPPTSWTITGSLTCRYAVFYEFVGKKIRSVNDLGGDKVVADSTITITWDATNGIVKCS